MWQAQPELYEVINKEYSDRINRMLVVLAYMWLWPFAHDLPFYVFACLCAADDATNKLPFFKHEPDTNHYHVVVSQ